MNTLARLSLLTGLVLTQHTMAMDREIINRVTGKGINKDYALACQQALEQAKLEAIQRSSTYVENTLDIFTRSHESEGSSRQASTPAVQQTTVTQTVAIQQGLVRAHGKTQEQARTLSESGARVVECVITGDFEVDTASMQAFLAARQAKLARQAAADALTAQSSEQIKQNNLAFQRLKTRMVAATPAPQRVSRSSECAHKDDQACERVIHTELKESVRHRVARQAGVDPRYLHVAVKTAGERRQYEQVSPGRDRLVWSADVSYDVSIEDPWAAENASLKAQMEAQRQVNAVSVDDRARSAEDAHAARQPVGDFSWAVLGSYGCRHCEAEAQDFDAVGDATVGGDGLLLQAVYRQWLGVTAGVFREKSVVCALTVLRGERETCSDVDTLTWHSLGVGPYLAYGPLTFEALSLQPIDKATFYGLEMPQGYWLGRLSLRFVSRDTGVTLMLGYARRFMPDDDTFDWQQDNGATVDLGYTF